MSDDFVPLNDHYDSVYRNDLEDTSMRVLFEYFDVDVASELTRLNTLD